MNFEDFNHVAGGIESLATVVALAVGGYWAYTRFIKERENFAFIEFTVDVSFIGKQGEAWIVELLAHLENKGKVQHRFSDLSFDLAYLLPSDSVATNPQYNGQAYFPREMERCAWIPSGEYFIEPGVKSKYSYIARLPIDTNYVMLHGHFTYKNQNARHTAERTLAVPR